MKMKKTMTMALAFSLAFVACNKNAPPSVNNPTEGQKTAYQVLPEKLISLSAEECNKVIKAFKDYLKESSLASKVSSGDMPADSSVWLLEASINYDFDKLPTSAVTSHDSCGYEVNLSNSSVTLSDLNNAYNYIYNYIIQNSSVGKSVKLIDVTSYVSNNKLLYSFHIVYFNDGTSSKVLGPCDLYDSSSGGGAWNQCGSPDGLVMTEVKLNCVAYDHGCGQGWYWTSITDVFFNNQNGAYSSSLYYNASTTNTCPWLTYSTINGYITGCRNLGTSNHPGGSYILIDYDITWGMIWLGGFSNKLWWDLKIRYGIPQCNNNNG